MIDEVTFEKTTYSKLPNKFEAGTPNIAGVIASGVALDYLNNIGFEKIEKYESKLLDYATRRLIEVEGVKIYGNNNSKTSVISFNVSDFHHYDIGSIIDNEGIAVRTGHHCAQPIMDYFNISGTIRISLSFYNTEKEIDTLINAITIAKKMLI